MNPCQNCGKLNSPETNFCRFCGTKFTFEQTAAESPFDYSAPRPYSWKTDEFQTQNEPRKTLPIDRVQPLTNQLGQAGPNYQPQALAYQQAQPLSSAYGCMNCGSRYIPRLERQISTAGWITFAVLLVFFFPLFWIGLLIKEDVQVCQVCNSKTRAQLYR